MLDLELELDFAKELAADSAKRARERHRSVAAQEKENKSFVTDLDLELEKLIRARIAERFPEDQITGEELAPSGGTGVRRWCIDPIDGTGNLVHGLPLWSVSIGLLNDGDPVLGVISVPPTGELFWAVKGAGAYLDGARIRAADQPHFHEHDNVSISTNAVRAIDPRTIPGRIRDLGTACCELAFVACGRVRASIFLGEQAHDLAAGVVIASEAGCEFATLDGIRLSAGDFVASAPVRTPTLIAPPMRLKALAGQLRKLDAPQPSH